MAGLYLHIPFCRSFCIYCDFHSCIPRSSFSSMIEALCREMSFRADYLSGEPIETIYIGGGTPSLFSCGEIKQLLDHIESLWDLKNCIEIAIEANPDDLTLDYLKTLRSFGINRLSIGIQSFNDKMLKFLRRRHNAQAAIDSVRMAREAGFDNVSIDLIFGIPGMSMSEWKASIEQAIDLGVEHISAYHLTVEEGTPLYKEVEAGRVCLVDEQASNDQFLMLKKMLEDAGIHQYEISNYARRGFHSRHNSNYWKSIPYLGIGPGAHSYDGFSRSWNIADNEFYIEKSGSKDCFETEELTSTMRYNEYIMTALRTCEGIDFADFEQKLGAHKLYKLQKQVEKQVKNNNLILTKYGCKIPQSRFMTSDGIISELFEV